MVKILVQGNVKEYIFYDRHDLCRQSPVSQPNLSAGLSPRGGGVRTFHLAKVRGGSQFDFINLAIFQFGDISCFPNL